MEFLFFIFFLFSCLVGWLFGFFCSWCSIILLVCYIDLEENASESRTIHPVSVSFFSHVEASQLNFGCVFRLNCHGSIATGLRFFKT